MFNHAMPLCNLAEPASISPAAPKLFPKGSGAMPQQQVRIDPAQFVQALFSGLACLHSSHGAAAIEIVHPYS